MATGSFPTHPGSRKAILVLQQHDIEKCAYSPGAAQALLDEEAYILPFPLNLQDDSPAALQNIADERLANPGALLVQSPYDPDSYADTALAPQRFALEKHMFFSQLCMKLGAKEVNVEQMDLRTDSGKSTLNIDGERLDTTVGGKVESEELEKFRAQMQLRDVFKGGPPDVVSAERLLRRTGLWADPNMRSLVEMRRDGENTLLTRKLVLSLSREGMSNLNVAGRLEVPAFVKLSADYKRVVKQQHEYSLVVSVRF